MKKAPTGYPSGLFSSENNLLSTAYQLNAIQRGTSALSDVPLRQLPALRPTGRTNGVRQRGHKISWSGSRVSDSLILKRFEQISHANSRFVFFM